MGVKYQRDPFEAATFKRDHAFLIQKDHCSITSSTDQPHYIAFFPLCVAHPEDHLQEFFPSRHRHGYVGLTQAV